MLGVATAVVVWRFRARAEGSRRGQRTPQRTANEVPGHLPDGRLTPLREHDHEDEEQLTPKAKTPSASVHPRFKKIGSRISVTWN